MNLTWHTFSGGTSSTKHGYQTSKYAFGQYDIQPVSNSLGRPIGYLSYFLNTSGSLPGGLWQLLGRFHSPNEAKSAAKKHYQTHFAKKSRR